MMQPQSNGVQCNYCKKPRHTIDRCYKPQRQRNDRGQLDRNRRVAASVQQTSIGADVTETHSSGQHTLTSEQYTQLISLLSKQNMEITPHTDNSQAAFLAGKTFCFLSAQPSLHWIVDSGATDHITPHLHLFHSYTTVSRPCFIIMPNGKQVQVSHIGSVILNSNITL